MKWKKLGKVYEPNGSSDWCHTHAMVPIAEHLYDDIYKIYFSPRDVDNRCHVAWLIIDLNNPQQILEQAKKPILSPGKLGTFDDSGAMANSIINIGDKKYLYYQGVNLGVTVPFKNSIGLAISSDGGETFQKFSEGPLLDRTYAEPHFCATPMILKEDGVYKMWYLSCIRWEPSDNKPKHYYHIKYAESNDGIDWDRKGIVAIDFKNDDEYAIAVPRVIKEDGVYKMWYSYRGNRYRIGYAESENGINWIRKDHLAGITVSDSGWDNDMIEYPFIFDHKGLRYMLYNGNGYGKTGFGLAVLT